jgi:hypothetical protein
MKVLALFELGTDVSHVLTMDSLAEGHRFCILICLEGGVYTPNLDVTEDAPTTGL